MPNPSTVQGDPCVETLALIATHPRPLTRKGVDMPESIKSRLSENTIAALSYITFVPAIYFLIIPRYNRSAYIRFHAWQSLIPNVAFIISVTLSFLVLPAMKSEAGIVLGLVRAMWGVWFGLWIATAIGAMRGKEFKIWMIGSMATRQANPAI
jgi:uncharacterized membrane protein